MHRGYTLTPYSNWPDSAINRENTWLPSLKSVNPSLKTQIHKERYTGNEVKPLETLKWGAGMRKQNPNSCNNHRQVPPEINTSLYSKLKETVWNPHVYFLSFVWIKIQRKMSTKILKEKASHIKKACPSKPMNSKTQSHKRHQRENKREREREGNIPFMLLKWEPLGKMRTSSRTLEGNIPFRVSPLFLSSGFPHFFSLLGFFFLLCIQKEKKKENAF